MSPTTDPVKLRAQRERYRERHPDKVPSWLARARVGPASRASRARPRAPEGPVEDGGPASTAKTIVIEGPDLSAPTGPPPEGFGADAELRTPPTKTAARRPRPVEVFGGHFCRICAEGPFVRAAAIEHYVSAHKFKFVDFWDHSKGVRPTQEAFDLIARRQAEAEGWRAVEGG
jgi:hypothetical protein